MEIKNNLRSEIKAGFISGIPIIIGYLPVAIAFGMLSKSSNISLIYSIMFSVFVYAGASQFMALNLLTLGAGAGEIIITTLLVNLRHFLMSATIASKLKDKFNKATPFIAYGITDEVFSVVAVKDNIPSKAYLIALQLAAYLSWNIGTIIGYILGNILPAVVGNSMQIALYSMFVAILVPEARRSYRIALLALMAGLVHMGLVYIAVLPRSWNMITAIILVSLLGTFVDTEKEVAANE